MNIVFIGMPGSGKGTQALMLAQKLNIPAISTGDVLRKEIEQKSEIGNLAKSYVDRGDLVPDAVMVGVVKSRITQQDCANGFILDGFPRNIPQANLLDEMLESLKKRVEAVFDFRVDEEILVKRISGRFSCKSCGTIYNRYFKTTVEQGKCDKCGSSDFLHRSDDNESVVRNRLAVYNNSSSGLGDYYKNHNLLFSVNAEKSSDSVFNEILSEIFGRNQK